LIFFHLGNTIARKFVLDLGLSNYYTFFTCKLQLNIRQGIFIMTQPENDFPKMSRPAHQALAAAGYTRLEQLTKVTEAEILKLHGMGPKAMGELREALKAKGWSFAPKK
jgi:hypothetical protein